MPIIRKHADSGAQMAKVYTIPYKIRVAALQAPQGVIIAGNSSILKKIDRLPQGRYASRFQADCSRLGLFTVNTVLEYGLFGERCCGGLKIACFALFGDTFAGTNHWGIKKPC